MDINLLLTGVLLAGALLLGALVIALAGRWRRRLGDDRLTPSDQLAQYRKLYEQGAISQEEYNRLRGLLGAQMRQGLDLPVKEPPKPAAGPGRPPEAPPSGNGSPPAPSPPSP